MTAPPRGAVTIPHAVRRTGIAPALLVSVTALFVLPGAAGGFRLAKWGAFGIALAALAVALLKRRPRLPAPRQWLPVGGFVAAAVALPVLTSALSPTHWPTALGMVSGLALWLTTTLALDDDASRRANLIVLAVAGALCALLVLLQAAGLRWLTSDVYTGAEFRAPGTFGNPNWAAAFLAPLAPLSLGLGATAPRRWPHYAIAALLAIATVATLSKGGALTLVAGVLVFVLLDRKVPGRRRLALLAVASACSAGALTVAWREDLFVTAPWLRGRIFLWQNALFLASERPLTGLGLGGYVPAYGRSSAALIDGDPTAFVPLSSVDFAHNDVLQYAAEGGFVTVAAFVLVVVYALASAHRRGDPLARGVGAAVAAIFVNGLADSPMRVPSTFALFFFLLGWLPATSRSANEERCAVSGEGPGRGDRSRRAEVVLVAIAVLGALQGVRFTAGNAAWTRGRDALLAGRPAVADLERARFYLPEHGRSAAQHARALARAGKIDAALDALSVAATLRFDFDDELLRCDLQTRSLDRDAAIRLWQDLAGRFPSLVTPHLRLGVLHLQANDRDAAIDAFQTVLDNPQPTERADAARRQARGFLRFLQPGSSTPR